MLPLTGGVFLGWALGSNDAANIFGTAVASRIIRYSTAVVLAAAFVLLGALVGGTRGLETLSGIAQQSGKTAFIVTFVAAVTVTIMTYMKLPVSTSQAVMGAIVGMGISKSISTVDWQSLVKIGACWVGTPLGAALLSIILYPSVARMMELLKLNVITRSYFIRSSLTIAGCYGAYALGANNVANVTGPFYATGVFDQFAPMNPLTAAALIGGGSIALGTLTFSKNVMKTVGSKLVPMDGFSAMIAVLASAVTVHVYALIGVPVSTSQAIVGGVLGIGLHKGMRTVNRKTLMRILFGWVVTPVIPGVICLTAGKIFCR